MYNLLPKEESKNRIEKFLNMMDENGKWDNVIIINRIHQYYFTGTMQDALLIFNNKTRKPYLFVRRDYDRAKAEATIDDVYKIRSYKDIVKYIGNELSDVYIEMSQMTMLVLNRIKKYLNMNNIFDVDRVLDKLLSVKSEYELNLIRKCGQIHSKAFNDVVPNILKEGLKEKEFQGILYNEKIKLGSQGVVRFKDPYNEVALGQFSFGKNALVNTNHDGPGGMQGLNAIIPIVGGEDALKKGDLVFVATSPMFEGYQTDKTQVYNFKGKVTNKERELHHECMEILNKVSSLLKPGNKPSDIYTEIMSNISSELKENFMGYKDRKVSFLGHGVGMFLDGYPVIANGFNEPLKENMVLAVEPKCGVDNRGIVGVEETFIVSKEGGECITGGARDIIDII